MSGKNFESGKLNAAKLALEYVKDGAVIGLGSGTTVEVFLKLLGEKIKEGLEVYAVPSSVRSRLVAKEVGVRIIDLHECPEPDVCIDGADQVDAKMNCIKGGGGALTREKIVAAASRKVVIMVDESKISGKLDHLVPVEVLPFSLGYVVKRIEKLFKAEVRLREGSGKLGPVVTDNGNFIIDCDFGVVNNPEELETTLNCIPGVVENGVFPSRLIDCIIIGKSSGESGEILRK